MGRSGIFLKMWENGEEGVGESEKEWVGSIKLRKEQGLLKENDYTMAAPSSLHDIIS